MSGCFGHTIFRNGTRMYTHCSLDPMPSTKLSLLQATVGRLTCAYKSGWVWCPISIWCTYCCHIPSWNKPCVTSKPNLCSLSCALVGTNVTICWESGITTVGWKKKIDCFQPKQLSEIVNDFCTCTNEGWTGSRWDSNHVSHVCKEMILKRNSNYCNVDGVIKFPGGKFLSHAPYFEVRLFYFCRREHSVNQHFVF